MLICNLFSIFDPSLFIFSFFSWIVIITVNLFLVRHFWGYSFFYNWLVSRLQVLKKEIGYVLVHVRAPKGIYLFIGQVFFFLVLLNFLALFPFVFSSTSHILVTLPLAYVFWLRIIFFSLGGFLKNFLSHLLPVGTPLGLMRFIVIVEFLRNLIRPLALTFRLTANMIAGHLLMSLVGGSLVAFSFSFIVLGSFFQFFLVVMEMGVSVIQAYVFSVLLLLYLTENAH